MKKSSFTKPSSGPDATKKRANPFEERANHRARHPALNRKVRGAQRNVGQARTVAKEKRETVLLQEFQKRHKASEVMDKRFGEEKGGDKLTHEEKMLKRFQTVRSKKRAGRFLLGDDAAGLEDDQDDEAGEGLTHMGKSLSEVLDEENIVEDENDDDEDVDQLIQRLKNGESLHGLSAEPKKFLTKREAMLDVVKKSKILKMERQREKEDDEDERERVDALMRDVVIAGGLSFRPTGEAKLQEQMKERKEQGGSDEYERMVRELQMDRGPRAQATERTKSAEEIAQDELKELERAENERIKRMENGDESDAAEDGDDASSEDGKKSRKDKRKKPRSEDRDDIELAEDDLQVPFVIPCPSTHTELLEFLHAHPKADLGTIISRIRKSTSIHLKAENKQKLARFVDVLLDHLASLAERHAQLTSAASNQQKSMSHIIQHLYEILSDIPKEGNVVVFNRLEHAKKVFETQLSNKKVAVSGDYGRNVSETGKSTLEKKLPGGHKDGLAEALNAELAHLQRLRGDVELGNSACRCWPSNGDFALFAAIHDIFSTTDQRHPIVSSAALLLARYLSECPIRGPRDVVSAMQVAQILRKMTQRPNEKTVGDRFAPEILLLLRIILVQLSFPRKETKGDQKPIHERLYRLDSNAAVYHPGFDFMREALSSVSKDGLGEASTLPRGILSYVGDVSDQTLRKAGKSCLFVLFELVQSVAHALQGLSSADTLVGDLVESLKALGKPVITTEVLQLLEKSAQECKSTRKPLRLQEFAPDDTTLAPRFLMDSDTAKRPGQPDRMLKKKLKEERKGVARELRLDGQFIAEARNKEKQSKLHSARAERQQNFRQLQGQQAQFNQLVRDGVAVKGAGVGGLKLHGKRMGRKAIPEDE